MVTPTNQRARRVDGAARASIARHRGRPKPKPKPKPKRSTGSRILPEMILDIFGRLPKRSGEVHALLLDSYGQIAHRNVIRYLGRLARDGHLERVIVDGRIHYRRPATQRRVAR